MKNLTHSQAQAWIQAAADGLLTNSQQQGLQAHLDGCADCQAYAAEIQIMESALKHTLQAQWGMPELPPHAIEQVVRAVKINIGKGDSFMKNKGSSMKWLLGLGAVGALGVVGLILILGIGSYRVYSQLGAHVSTISPISIWFDNPQQGSQLPGESTIPIQAVAEGPNPILYMQLETAGQVVGTIGAPSSQGITPFTADFNWSPGEIKPYTLTARAFDTLGNESQATLFLNIVTPDQATEEDVQNAYVSTGLHAPSGLGQGGGDVPQPLNEQPPYQPPAPPDLPAVDLTTVYEVSKPWSPSVFDWFQSFLPKPSKPTAPGIPATAVEGCKPRIWISDNSDNEDGFRVFRRDPGNVSFLEIAALDAHVGQVLTFDDLQSNLFGTYEYQVSAFNQGGESFSNISTPVVVDSPNCQPAVSKIIKIDFSKIFTNQSYDKGYCYSSFDALNWQRYPLNPDEFFGPGAAGQIPQDLQTVFEGSAQAYDLECWGWFGGGLQLVGSWHFDDVLQDHSELGLAIVEDGFTKIVPYGGTGGGPFDPDLPVPYAGIGLGPEDCAKFYNMPFALLKGLLCGSLNTNVQFVYAFYLCIFGGCTPQEDIVGYNFYDTLSGSWVPVKYVDAPENIYFPIDPSACAPRLIHVTMLVNVDGEVHESFPSNQVIYTPEDICDYLAGTEPRMYRITWETIDFSVGNIDDGADVDDDAEGFGYLGLNTGTGHKIYWHMPLHDDGFEDDAEDNPYFFSNFLLSKHDSPCVGIYCWLGGATGSSTSNNTANFPLYIGEGFNLIVHLTEFDDDMQHDTLCIIDPYSDNFNWHANAIGGPGWVTTVSRTKHHNYASCKVTVKIEGLP